MTDIRKLTASERVYAASTPIFTPEMGQRLKLARMKLLMDQSELGEKLGCSQSAISHLEKGSQKTSREPFTVLQFKDVFGPLWTYVLFGTNEASLSPAHIRKVYWDARLKRGKV